MNRKDFIKAGFQNLIGMGLALPLAKNFIGTAQNPAACQTTPAETEGPFPTHDPASLQMVDITSDRLGVPMEVQITIRNTNADCAVLNNAIVDIWHCDRNGYYSEYGATMGQQADFRDANFLRGRQVTNNQGMVAFKTIFPGWYRGRAPHIHVHIYNNVGTSLLVTQIAFPKDVTDTVYTTATNFYTAGTQDTLNENDNVFRDGVELELATVTGNITDGYLLTHEIMVAGARVDNACGANAGTIQFN